MSLCVTVCHSDVTHIGHSVQGNFSRKIILTRLTPLVTSFAQDFMNSELYSYHIVTLEVLFTCY